MKAFAATNALARLVPAATSAALHVSIFAAMAGGHGVDASPSRSTPSAQLELVEIEPEVEPAPAQVFPKAASGAAPTHRHPYPVPASHDARAHDSSVVHIPTSKAASPAEAPAAVVQVAQAAPRFTMALGTSSQASRVVASSAAGAGEPGTPDSIVSEAGVSTPARLQSAAPAAYPPSARADQVEADVPVEIVVDKAGSVTDVRPLRRAGYGFDEAALEAVRKYRFSPAQKNGRAVRVRMRWIVQFRLN